MVVNHPGVVKVRRVPRGMTKASRKVGAFRCRSFSNLHLSLRNFEPRAAG